MLVGVVLTAVVVVAGCGDSRRSTDWVAGEIYVVDDRAACMTVTDRLDGRQLSVCRDDGGAVTCRPGVDPRPTTGSDCDAAIQAVEDWETESSDSGP